MRDWDLAELARGAGAHVVAGRRAAIERGPRRAVIDSRSVGPGDLFVGLRGARVDGGEFARQALGAGAWGVLVGTDYAQAAAEAADAADAAEGAAVLAHPDPLAGLQALARAWVRSLKRDGARVVAITGSTGKTSTKDILFALLAERLRTVASPQNLNTEIGLPLAVLGAPPGTQALVLEMAMRGPGQIAELAAIAEPDVGVIVNIGPVHLELLGTLEAIAAAKAELIAGLEPGATIVVPADEPLLASHLRADLLTSTFGRGGDFMLEQGLREGEVVIREGGRSAISQRMVLTPSFAQAHNLRNLLAAVAAARALGITPQGKVEVSFSALRGERVELAGGVVVIDDCYNANPMSMRAAIDALAECAPARRVAVLGDMLELGSEAPRLHREVAAHANERGVELLVTVGPLAREMSETFAGEIHSVTDAPAAAELLETLLLPRDTVLVKGSRGVGLERVARALRIVQGKHLSSSALDSGH
jgi:UDP-N-acetylmuramoyl-tripeptide--D-alanyl-D-alanine ligase